MKNVHYREYWQWRQVSLFLFALTVIGLTIVQAIYYYKLIDMQRKFKNLVIGGEPVERQMNGGDFLQEFNQIDRHTLHNILDALIAIMPPDVKVEKMILKKGSGFSICLRAAHEAAVADLLHRYKDNAVLNNLRLIKSVREENGMVLVLE